MGLQIISKCFFLSPTEAKLSDMSGWYMDAATVY